MKRLGILASSVVIGFVVSAVLYYFLAFGILDVLVSRSGESPESYLGVAFLVFLPLSLFIGGFVTGCLAGQYVKGIVGSFCVTPGLYLALAVVPRSFVGTISGYGVGMLIAGVVWIAASWAGVAVGRHVRARMR